MKFSPNLATLTFLATASLLSADTFTMKDGTTIEGAITSEDAEKYTLEVQVTKSIKDERTILKADVVKVEREQPDLVAFAEIKLLFPVPDLSGDDEYGRIAQRIQKFLQDHPASGKSKEAKEMLTTIKAESAQIAAGGLKFNGQIITPADYKKNACELDARVHEAKIRTLIKDGKLLVALRLFSDFDEDFRGTLPYNALIPLIQQAIQAHVTESKQALETLDERTRKRAQGLERMSQEDRGVTGNAIKDEEAEIEALFTTQAASDVAWVTTHPFHKASLESTVKQGEVELSRLVTMKTSLGQDTGRAYREAWTVIQGGNPAAVTAALATAKTAGLSVRYLDMLQNASNN